MQLFINNEEVSLKNVEFYNWYHLIDWLLRNKIDNKQGIVELKVDGRSCRHVLSDLNAEPFPEQTATIEITTQNAYEISLSGLGRVRDLLDALQRELPPLTEQFRNAELQQGSASLSRFIQSLIPMIDFIQSISQNFQIDFSIQQIGNNMTIQDMLTQLKGFFEELNAAQERSDAIELADLLEFELAPILESCLATVAQLELVLPDTALRTSS